MRLQPIYDIAEICAQKGITEAVLCPGSRCAPLTSAFVAHNKINTRTFSDERSAAFIANGIALFDHDPVVLVCTSGSAAYNFAPGISEAFYQHIPLIVLTADRPKEWVDQLDGQTIRQGNIYGSHVKKYYELPQDYEHEDSLWYINRCINEAINLSRQFPKGPVHINIPLREPLYPAQGETIQFSSKVRIIESVAPYQQIQSDDLNQLRAAFNAYNKILIVAGQQFPNSDFAAALDKFSKQHHVPVVADVITNLHTLSHRIAHADAMLGQSKPDNKKALQPELLITFGKSVISKNLKTFLRNYKPVIHWHIQPEGEVADTYQSLTSIIPASPLTFFQQFSEVVSKTGFDGQKRENYYRLWEAEEHRTQRAVKSFFSIPQLNEFSLVNEIIKNCPQPSHLHLSNSMSVRYANFIGLHDEQKEITVFANRGTSGIDGCTSTAVGHGLASNTPTILITGDMAFFYDRNAFWHNYQLPNLRIVVLNNHGGAIFGMIDGPEQLPELDEYFITHQKLSARNVAIEYDFDYLKLDSLKKLKNLLKDFFDFDGRTKILEIESTAAESKVILDNFKKQIKSNYEA
ncbi:MAG: 2-succinyl-5-enolpyruvyl-6-hydroxy-3-cyclohexene-1-carboxylic-acid synthase [Cyclobacteriaceae bacterium]|nr:2-succinyl-5-enolpyruvyl-6-hydroxy-3-cyclohexene-1-carboxylic-acid synthase [Cyclobacteriaceae bacterium]